ncbi:hypothetical protein E3C22_19705 [Jiella endophytica]|uniref:Uncharacterized protein n=1 Tax=Jiella endophytica TaxID=2558362 RepID=A0A4Y8RDI8_9HYPH|nr:hypothetical protein [Jiella endophytica]TFF19887.1 hypothetical protein E3C22_19705 [Jiella endophytica]
MSEISEPRTAGGAWLIVAASAVGALVAAFNAVNLGNGIAFSFGAWLVLVSSILVLGAALILALHLALSGASRGVLAVLILLGILGTGAAAYFLIAWVLVAAMGVALVGWVIHVAADPSPLD